MDRAGGDDGRLLSASVSARFETSRGAFRPGLLLMSAETGVPRNEMIQAGRSVFLLWRLGRKERRKLGRSRQSTQYFGRRDQCGGST